MKKIKINRERLIKISLWGIEALGVALICYLLILPVYPKLKYELFYSKQIKAEDVKDIEVIKKQTRDFRNAFPETEYKVSPNRLIISKIGVNAPIVESANEEYGLSKGAWRVPETSTPPEGGNTVITGHRFKYLPPNNLTFYLFHELEAGDYISVIWGEEDYQYRIRETKVVPDTEVSILNPTNESILTLYTCDPIYSTENRLVVIADEID